MSYVFSGQNFVMCLLINIVSFFSKNVLMQLKIFMIIKQNDQSTSDALGERLKALLAFLHLNDILEYCKA